MTVAREWGIPIALGLLVAAGLWAGDFDGEDGHAPTGSTSTGPRQPVLLATPFAESVGAEDTETTFLLVAPKGRTAAEDHLRATGHDNVSLRWVGGNEEKGLQAKVAFHAQTHHRVACSDGALQCPGPQAGPLPLAWAKPQEELGPRLGLEGYNGTRATIYVFDERGLLAATNDEEGNWSRFGGAPTTMGQAVWYIGANETAPPGTQKPPSFAAPFVQRLRPLMEGLPVGGVASTQSNAYVSLYGTLFITIRVDALVHAP